MTRATLEAAVPKGAIVVLDSSAVLSYLAGSEETSGAATVVLDEFVRTGRNVAIVSAATVTESLVRVFGSGNAPALANVETFLQQFPNLSVKPVDYPIAREAARIRALTGLRTPDALVVATAMLHQQALLVANDDRWLGALGALDPAPPLCHLSAHAPVEAASSEGEA